MKNKIKFLFVILGIFSITTTVQASDLEMVYDTSKLTLDVSGGYRLDKLDWNVASDKTGTVDPIIAREVKFSKLQIFEYKISGTLPIFTLKDKPTISYKPYYIDTISLYRQNLYLSGSFAKGNISSGSASDIQNDSTNAAISQVTSSVGGSTQDFEASLNYDLIFKYIDWQSGITPMIGYSQFQQNLTMNNGVESIAVPTGPINGLKNTFDAKWKGPFIGLSAVVNYNDKHIFTIGGKYYFVNYNSSGDLNLNNTVNHPKSFSQKSTGSGKSVYLQYAYKIFENFAINFTVEEKKFIVDGGTQTTYNSDDTATKVKLNKAEWSSTSALVGFKLNF